jgi:hypothetical protein
VTPQDGLKKVVWSELQVTGGKRFTGRVPAPPSTTGPFQELAMTNELGALEGTTDHPPAVLYADIAVIAVPVSQADIKGLPSAMSGTGKSLDAAPLFDGRLDTSVSLARGTSEAPALVAMSYAAPQTIRAVTFFLEGAASIFGDPQFLPIFQLRSNGAWQDVARLPLTGAPTTVSFAPVTAQEFRIVLGPNTEPRRIGLGDGAPGAIVFDLFGATGYRRVPTACGTEDQPLRSQGRVRHCPELLHTGFRRGCQRARCPVGQRHRPDFADEVGRLAGLDTAAGQLANPALGSFPARHDESPGDARGHGP